MSAARTCEHPCSECAQGLSVSDNTAQRFLERLHEVVGSCGHCGAKKCAGRRQHSVLPDKVKTDDILAALALAEAVQS